MDDEDRLRKQTYQAINKKITSELGEDNDKWNTTSDLSEAMRRLQADQPGRRIENYDIITALQQEIGDLKARLAEKLTKREKFAAMALQGYNANTNMWRSDDDDKYKWAVKDADKLH
jgi:ABC-type molybdenum transport system ATPase subunit/photorepair protein PhrA